MRTGMFGAVAAALLACGPACAADATWVGTTGDWSDPANWSGNAVPTDAARFDAAGVTKAVTFPFPSATVGQLQFASSGYSFHLLNGLFTINGAGITGSAASFVVEGQASGPDATLTFANSATAASANFHQVDCGIVNFVDTSTAATASFVNDSCAGISFRGTATAANGSFTNAGGMLFLGNATAANAVIASTASGPFGSSVEFAGNSTAGSASISLVGQGTQLVIAFNASGGQAHVTTQAGTAVNLLVGTGPNGDHQISIGSIDGDGDVWLGSNQLTIGGDNRSMRIGGVVEDDPNTVPEQFGGGLIKTGTGTLTLAGIDAYAGATVVNGGTLAVTGSIAASSGVAVRSGVLAGTGTVPTTSVAFGGVIAPGNGGVGTLTMTGSVSFAGGAALAIDVQGATADKLAVAGTATLSGTLIASVLAAPAVGTKFTVLTASDGVTGTFQLSGQPLGAVVPKLSYDAHDVFLEFVQGTLSGPGSGTNAGAVIGGIDAAIVAGHSLPQAFQDLGALPANALTAQATQMSGEAGASLPAIGQSTANSFLTVLMNRAGDPGTGLTSSRGSSPRFAQLGYHSLGAPLDARLMGGEASVWLTGLGGSGTTKGDPARFDTRVVTSSLAGVAAGVDVAVDGDTTAGLAFAEGHDTFALEGALGKGSADVFQAGAYATERFGAGYLSAAGSYGTQDMRTIRTVAGIGAATLTAKVNAQNYAGRIEGGYRFGLGGAGVTPYVAVQADDVDIPAYAEVASTGSPVFALAYAAHSGTAARLEIGAGFDARARLARNSTLHLFARLAYAHDSGTDQKAFAAFQSLAGSDFVVRGASPGLNAGLLSLGAEVRGRNGLSLGLMFDGSMLPHGSTYFGALDVRYTW